MALLRIHGIDLAYERSGDPRGTPILLIMGLGMQLVSWPEEFVEGLGDLGYNVIRFDNRDSGLSSKFRAAGKPNLGWTWLKSKLHWPIRPAYTLDDMAGDALAVLNALGIGRAHVVGVAMGGMIGQVLTAKHPERVLSLTSIMSSSGRRGLPGPSREARAALLERPRNTKDRAALVEHMLGVMRTIGSPAYPMPERLLRQRIVRSLARSICPDGVARQMAAITASGDRSEMLRTIAVPTLVIHGAADPVVPLQCGIDTASLIPGARLEIIEGMGHDLPPALTERLLALIDAHTRGKMLPDPIPRLFEKQ